MNATAPTHYASRSAWAQAWFNCGRELGQKGSPCKQLEGIQVDRRSWGRNWLPFGINVYAYPVDGKFRENESAVNRAWQNTAVDTFTQLPLDIPISFSPVPNARIARPLRAATDTTAKEISYAKFMDRLYRVRDGMQRAVYVMSDARLRPHNWDTHPDLRSLSVAGLTSFESGVVVTGWTQPEEYTAAVRIHELFHLLGFREHHESFLVEGYPEEGRCVMNTTPNSPWLCTRDREALVSFWRGVEVTLNRRILLRF